MKTKTTTKINRRAGAFALAALFFSAGCEPASLKKPDSSASPTAASANASTENNASSFENDLETMRTADFDFIYAFRRKDGGTLDGEDKKFLRANSPAATNRFILSDGNRAVIAGSSYKFEQANLDKLQERFVIENFSKPVNEAANSANANAAQNTNRNVKE